MQWEGFVVGIGLFLGLLLLIFEKVSAEVIFLSELVLFWNLGIIDTEEALNGFSNRGLIAIGTLYILVAPLSCNYYLNVLCKKVLNGKNMKLSMIKTCGLIAFLSAFLNNIPLVQLITPMIRKYSRQNHFSSSRFLMPISFSSIIGGMMTLIGTSTNIIIVSLLPSDIKINFFDPAIVGFPMLIVYFVYNYIFNGRLLPIRSGLFREIKNNFYILIRNNGNFEEMLIDFGITEEDFIGIYRDGSIIFGEEIVDGEYLCVKSNPEGIRKIMSEEKYEIKDCNMENIQESHNIFYECVVGNIINIDKKTFEHKYNCKILASRQMEETITRGTTLLVITGEDFYKLWGDSNDFYMVSLFNQEEMNKKKLPILFFIIMIGITGAGVMSIERSSQSLLVLFLIFGVIDIKTALNKINYSLLLVIGCSFGISQSMINSGISFEIAKIVSKIGGDWVVVFLIIQIITQILTEVISNNAVAALMTQIVVDICRENGYDMRKFVIGLMVSCSCSFITPYGYATNLIIQGSGGYKFMDYVRYGATVKVIGLMMSFLVYFI